MKQTLVMNIYPILQKIANCNLPYQLAWDLVGLIDETKPVFDFQMDKRRELYKKYTPEFIQETNEFKFESADDAKEFQAKQNELDDLECEITTQKIRIPIQFLEEGTIKPKELILLRESELVEIYKMPIVKLDENSAEEPKEENQNGN